jgi:LDH2 family malate/lactate/ureidoglycolate dehydrogenase
VVTLKLDELLQLGIDKMTRHGVPQREAEIASPIYLEAELWGKRTHGYRHLYNNLIQYREGTDRRTVLTVQRETPISALVDGGFHFPYYIHHYAMSLAITKAQENGLAMVGARNGGASGLLGYYSQMATEAGLVGIVINSAPSTVVPPGGIVPMLSTNPLTIGVPRPGKPPVILDMATSAGTFNQILVAQRDKKPLPEGMALDLEGRPTTDPFATVDSTNRPRLLPFAGYKGYGLALMIEMLCDASLGTPVGNDKIEPVIHQPAHFNGLYLAYRPDLFVDREVFEAQVEQLINDIKNSEKAHGVNDIRMPGEESQKRKAEILARGEIEIEDPTYEFLTKD